MDAVLGECVAGRVGRTDIDASIVVVSNHIARADHVPTSTVLQKNPGATIGPWVCAGGIRTNQVAQDGVVTGSVNRYAVGVVAA